MISNHFLLNMTKNMALSVKPGQTVKIYQKIKEVDDKGKEKERLQVFEGVVIAKHERKNISSTITVRKDSHGVGVEKIFPLHSPLIAKIETVAMAKVHRAKLHFLRKGSARKLKDVE